MKTMPRLASPVSVSVSYDHVREEIVWKIPFKGKLSREAHVLASCENLKSVRLTFSS